MQFWKYFHCVALEVLLWNFKIKLCSLSCRFKLEWDHFPRHSFPALWNLLRQVHPLLINSECCDAFLRCYMISLTDLDNMYILKAAESVDTTAATDQCSLTLFYHPLNRTSPRLWLVLLFVQCASDIDLNF